MVWGLLVFSQEHFPSVHNPEKWRLLEASWEHEGIPVIAAPWGQGRSPAPVPGKNLTIWERCWEFFFHMKPVSLQYLWTWTPECVWTWPQTLNPTSESVWLSVKRSIFAANFCSVLWPTSSSQQPWSEIWSNTMDAGIGIHGRAWNQNLTRLLSVYHNPSFLKRLFALVFWRLIRGCLCKQNLCTVARSKLQYSLFPRICLWAGTSAGWDEGTCSQLKTRQCPLMWEACTAACWGCPARLSGVLFLFKALGCSRSMCSAHIPLCLWCSEMRIVNFCAHCRDEFWQITAQLGWCLTCRAVQQFERDVD